MAHFLFDSVAWRKFFLPGLRSSLGPAWWAVLAFAAVGIIGVVIWRRSTVVRMLGLVAIGSVLAFLVTPQFLGTKTEPIFFQYNLRYASPGVLMGLALLPLVPVLARRTRLTVVAVMLLGVLGATQFDPTLWPMTVFSKPFSLPVSADESLVGAAIGVGIVLAASFALWLVRNHRRGRSAQVPMVATVALIVAVVIGGYPLQRHYLANRYTNQPPAPTPRISAWAQNLHNSSIALVGFFTASQYPYYGRNSDNYVQYLVNVGPNGNLFPYSTCQAWRTALYRGGYDYLIIASSPEELWASTDRSYHMVTGQDIGGLPILVYRLGHRLDLRSCPAVRAHVVD